MSVIATLRSAGVQVHQIDRIQSAAANFRADAVIDVVLDKAAHRFAVEEKRRAPYPGELEDLEPRRAALSVIGLPLLVAPFVSESLGSRLIEAGWSWADGADNFDVRAPGLMLRQRLALNPPPRRIGFPKGAGSLGVVRALIRSRDEALRTTEVAELADVSQPRATQVLQKLEQLELTSRTETGRWAVARARLLDEFLAAYEGPGGSERFYFSLDSVTDVAVAAAKLGGKSGALAVSADVASDVLVPWRRPTTVILYARNEFDPDALGLVQAHGGHDANVIVRRPEDRSVFLRQTVIATIRRVKVPLADASQILWDTLALGGDDRLEGAELLRRWILGDVANA